ncbi:3-carboxy-cis,cis-muconate cycloisomerase [Collimonas sp. OK607]|uniref:class-II fumarase/aspartase family protein n=1 Tax=Collimonas sp. OK607 TaxID=1798194 RepID=UPI0008E5EF7F|nr:adenylosuccinate lyase family protein [Collimonas sp. OK607]SFB16822.1 3-carboxy-cis,cis-muconate cycloisomerase [Collimonas sp. OK607]
MINPRFTDSRVPNAGIRTLFDIENRWQAWLDVEAALAQSQAGFGIIPAAASDAISTAAQLNQLDLARIRVGIAEMSHPLMPLIVELSRVVGEAYGGYVHWGATTQNITQTGDILVLQRVHSALLKQMSRLLVVLADLAERGADMVIAGRTHGQHAVPATFGFKVAVWIDELARHATRMTQLEPRLFVAIIGGAAGTFAALGDRAPQLQADIAQRLGLAPMAIPARSIGDHFAEYVCTLGLAAATCGKIGREIYTLMKTEFGEVEEPVPAGTVGSSTMPQKRNPQLCQDIINISTEIRSLVPLALEAAQCEHEADGTGALMHDAVTRASILTGDMLERIILVTSGLRLYPERMKANLSLSGGLIAAEAVMLELGAAIGRQHAHDVVYVAAQAVATQGGSFADRLIADDRVNAHLSADVIHALLEPSRHTGLSSDLARRGAIAARHAAADLEARRKVA